MTFGPTLHVDLAAITANWKLLSTRFSGRETGAVVKANAYGLGAVEVSRALEKAGCHTFFVATLAEALELRAALPDVRIVVFHGVQVGEEFAFINHRIIPALASAEQISRWLPVARDHVHAASMLHIDTGMARLGLQYGHAGLVPASPASSPSLGDPSLRQDDALLLKNLRCGAIMSHLACAPEPTHSLNKTQLIAMQHMRSNFPEIPISLCNSGGIFLADDFHFDLARPGCSLYGIRPQDAQKNPMAHVATWRAPMLQIRTLNVAQSVGYGATQTLPAGAKIATVASGYADGYLRALSGKAVGYLDDFRVPLVGRVTMDMLCFDVSAVPEAALKTATRIELLGDRDGIRVDDLADAAGTIGYEILTRIGTRVMRV
jgi:alanine racemase